MLRKASFDLNTVPFSVELLFEPLQQNHINFKLSLSNDFLDAQKIPLDKLETIFDGRLQDKLRGDLSIYTLYLRKGNDIKMQALFKGLEFDFRNLKEKYLKAGDLELVKVNTGKIQQLNFHDFSSSVDIGRDKIEINDLSFKGYNAKLNGSIKLNTKDEASLFVRFNGSGLDVKTVMQDINVSDKLLSGTMEATVVFDNLQKEFLVGDCKITGGVAKLDLVADILKLPSLKRVNFDVMQSSFSISKDTVSVGKIKLKNPQISLDSSWNSNGKIEGSLDLKASADLLNESRAFKRLLQLTQNKKQYIEFNFLLGGIPNSVRAMWMKGEFKDKIAEGLSSAMKRRIEKELDHLVEELSYE